MKKSLFSICYLFSVFVDAKGPKAESSFLETVESIFPKCISEKAKDLYNLDWNQKFSKSNIRDYVHARKEEIYLLANFKGTTLYVDQNEFNPKSNLASSNELNYLSNQLVISKKDPQSLFYPSCLRLMVVLDKFADNMNRQKKGLVVISDGDSLSGEPEEIVIYLNKQLKKDVKWTAIIDQPILKGINLGFQYDLDKVTTDQAQQNKYKQKGNCCLLYCISPSKNKMSKYVFANIVKRVIDQNIYEFTYQQFLECLRKEIQKVNSHAFPVLTSTREIDLDDPFVKKEITFRF